MHRRKLSVLGAVGLAAALTLSACASNEEPGTGDTGTQAAETGVADTGGATGESAGAGGTGESSGAADTAGASESGAASESDSGSAGASESGAASDSAGASESGASSAPAGGGDAQMTTVDLPDKDTYVIGYSQSNNAEPYRAQLNLQIQYFVKQHDNLKLLPISDAAQDSSKQVAQVQQFIQQKVDILIVSPNEADPLTPPVEQACKADIPVIVLDRTVNTDCIAAFIGGDNVAAGKAAGELAVELLPDGGNVVELQGILSNQPQIDRDTGFREAIAANPNIKIVEHQEAKWLKEDATKIMQQWLQSGTEIDLVYAENDPMALGAYLAAAGMDKQKDIKFIGTDGLAIPDGGIRAVQQGKLAGTFIYPTGAKEAVDTIVKMVSGEEFSAKQILPVTPVTPENAVELYKQYDFSNK